MREKRNFIEETHNDIHRHMKSDTSSAYEDISSLVRRATVCGWERVVSEVEFYSRNTWRHMKTFQVLYVERLCVEKRMSCQEWNSVQELETHEDILWWQIKSFTSSDCAAITECRLKSRILFNKHMKPYEDNYQVLYVKWLCVEKRMSCQEWNSVHELETHEAIWRYIKCYTSSDCAWITDCRFRNWILFKKHIKTCRFSTAMA